MWAFKWSRDDVTWPPKVLAGSTVGYPSDSLASCYVTGAFLFRPCCLVLGLCVNVCVCVLNLNVHSSCVFNYVNIFQYRHKRRPRVTNSQRLPTPRPTPHCRVDFCPATWLAMAGQGQLVLRPVRGLCGQPSTSVSPSASSSFRAAMTSRSRRASRSWSGPEVEIFRAGRRSAAVDDDGRTLSSRPRHTQ